VLSKCLGYARMRKANEGIAHVHVSPGCMPDRHGKEVVLILEANVVDGLAHVLGREGHRDVLDHHTEDFAIPAQLWHRANGKSDC